MVFTSHAGAGGGGEYVTGTYQGTGLDNRQVNLGFAPSCVILCGNDTGVGVYNAAVAVQGLPVVQAGPTQLELTNTGFLVNRYFNNSALDYAYIAFK